ncbi:hypothetical protein LX87_02095 [Larkinella arboricola]|uniref:Lipocalin-like domain-containing protein n=1 Tax=Larkinella arboricola TaxID=643671 RepID=A0A327X5L4_LARAB|nr:hypothetical protein [Larkinella arboricola]RAK00393.1 hypothetical protein LX87_02095 [Larkinella arboricola]
MKKLLVLPLLLAGILPGFGQCDKHLTLALSKTQYLDGSGAVQRTVEENSTVEISPSDVVITPGGKTDHRMNGKIQSNTCSWSVPYKEGKSVYKARFEDPAGNQQNTTLTIEGKDGNVTFLLEIAERPDQKIRVNVDTFEEKK